MNNVLRRAFIRAATLGASIGCIAAFASVVQAADLLKSTDAQEPPAIEQKLKTDKTIKRKRLVNVNAAAIASAATRRVTAQISLASCSTQPGRGKNCSNSE